MVERKRRWSAAFETRGGGEKNESTCHLFIEKSERYKKRLPPFVKKHKDFL